MAQPNTLTDLFRLQSSSSSATFEQTQVLARKVKENYSKTLNINDVRNVTMPRSMVDTTAFGVLDAQDTLNGKMPIRTTANGNCLFNAMSRAINGKENMATELRLRTALELSLNPGYYGAHPIVKELKLKNASGKEWPLTGLYDAVVFRNSSRCVQHTRSLEVKNTDKTSFQQAVEKEICTTFSNYAWSGLIQIMGLASAVGCNIQLLYPDKRHSLFPLLSGTYRPRISNENGQLPTITIMWTDMGGWKDREKEFQVNHFVPILPVDQITNEWVTVSKRRKLSSATANNVEANNYQSGKYKTSAVPIVPKQVPTTFHGFSKSRSSLTLNDFLVPRHKKPPINTKQSRKNVLKSKATDTKCTTNQGVTSSNKKRLHSDTMIQDYFRASVPENPERAFVSRKTLRTSVSQERVSVPQVPELASVSPEPCRVSVTPQKSEYVSITQQPERVFISHVPECASVSQEPERDSISQEPERGSISQEPEHDSISQEPERDSISQEPEYDSISQEPEHDSISEEPERDSISQEPEHDSISEEPERDSISQEPEHDSISEEPERDSVPQEPECASIPQQAERASISQKPEHVSASQESGRTSLPKTLQRSSISQELERISVPEQPACATVQKKPKVTFIAQEPKLVSVLKEPGLASISNELYNSSKILLSSPSNVSQDFIFPLKGVHRSFYRKRGELYYKNAKRNEHSKNRIRERIFDHQISDVKGTLKENVQTLKHKLSLSGANIASLKGVIAVGEYILNNGPLVQTRKLCEVYSTGKGSSSGRRMMAAELYGIVSKYLCVMQIYIEGIAFISERTTGNFEGLMSFINDNSLNHQKLVNDKVEKSVGSCFKRALEYMDTKRDRDTATAIMERITSVKFVTGKLLDVKNKRAVQTCRDMLKPNLNKYEDIKFTSQVVRNDMTSENQYKLSLRIANKRKSMEILHIAPGRGRILKCEENQSLVPLLEYAFMESDVRDRGGGGQQSHPRLIDDTLYRTPDSNTNMKKAREIVIALSSPEFHISLSCCYNYTQNYKKNTFQAKRHHDGQGINAKISLHNPPRVGVNKFVINTHWCSANVNYLVDDCEAHKDSCVIDSKDAKSIVPADVAPVQKPMKTWKQRSGILPDHDWEQGRTNAITPMAHLFMESRNVIERPFLKEELILPMSNSGAVAVTRTGKAVNLIYLSCYEPGTVFRCFNELLFLLAEPSLDSYFRNPKTKELKKTFCFVVDNGQSEQPSSSLVQMTLVRLCKFLNLGKVVQVSFAEYQSKRNFVERVHPQVNKALSDHGTFSSQGKHVGFQAPGSLNHKENMEHMANAVIDCLKGVQFGGQSLDVYRGPREDQWIFNDERELKDFLALTEYNKQISRLSYRVQNTPLLRSLEVIWNINTKFKGNYWEDYTALHGERKKAYLDKYTAIVFGENEADALADGCKQNIKHRQPLPDYIRWLATSGELHYLPYNIRCNFPVGLWDSAAGCFMPSNCLDLAYLLISKPTGRLVKMLALLCWVPEVDVVKYFDDKEKQLREEQHDGFQRLKWKQHELYRKKKNELEKMCSEKKIGACGKKYELVERVSVANEEEPPPEVDRFNGTTSLPTTTKEIAILPACYLQSVLQWHGMPSSGTKDELVLRVTLIANNRRHLCFNRERKMFLDMLSMVQTLVLVEKKQSLLSGYDPIYTQRTYTTPTSTTLSSDRPRYHASVQTQWTGKSRIDIPDDINSVETVNEMFSELQNYIKQSIPEKEVDDIELERTSSEIGEQAFLKVGVRVRAKKFCCSLGYNHGNSL